MTEHTPHSYQLSRRNLLRTAGLGAAALGGGSLLSACGGSGLKGSGDSARRHRSRSAT